MQLVKKRKEISTSSEPQTKEERINNEIEEYVKLTVFNHESNLVKLWKIRVTEFPVISKLARKYLCICASSSPSERLINVSGHVMSKKRNDVSKPDNVNMLVFLAMKKLVSYVSMDIIECTFICT